MPVVALAATMETLAEDLHVPSTTDTATIGKTRCAARKNKRKVKPKVIHFIGSLFERGLTGPSLT